MGTLADGGAAPCASDSNNCTSATCGAAGVGPCLTYGELVARWGSFARPVDQPLTVNILSDFPAPSADPMLLDARAGNGAAQGQVIINGSLVTLATATIGTFTARNRNAGTPNKITASGKSGSFWTPYVGTLINDTTVGAWFWIEKDLGTATAQITEPVQSTAAMAAPIIQTYITIANGDALTIERPVKAACGYLRSYGAPGNMTARHIQCTGAPGSTSAALVAGVNFAESRADSNISFNECMIGPPNGQPTYIANSYFDASFTTLNALVQAGAITSQFPVFGCSPGASSFGADSDILIDSGSSFHVISGGALGRAYFGPGVLLDTDGMQQLNLGLFDGGGMFWPDVELWGPGAIDAHDGVRIVCNTNCTQALLLTGGITFSNQASTQGYPWNAATHSWGALATLTPALIDDAGSVCNVPTGDCYSKHP